MSALKNEPLSPHSADPLPPHLQNQLNSHAFLAGALAGLHGPTGTDVATLPPALLTADKVLRRAAATPTVIPTPDGLAERTIAKCLTLALDGSMAGEVVV